MCNSHFSILISHVSLTGPRLCPRLAFSALSCPYPFHHHVRSRRQGQKARAISAKRKESTIQTLSTSRDSDQTDPSSLFLFPADFLPAHLSVQRAPFQACSCLLAAPLCYSCLLLPYPLSIGPPSAQSASQLASQRPFPRSSHHSQPLLAPLPHGKGLASLLVARAGSCFYEVGRLAFMHDVMVHSGVVKRG